MTPTSTVYRLHAPEPILVPAKGDAFDFRLRVMYVWTAEHMTYPELQARAQYHLPWAGGVLWEQAIDLARQFEPHRAHDLEKALNERLAARRWFPSDKLPRLTVRAWVSPDERVRELLQPYWTERLGLECQHELQKLRAAHAVELTRLWRAALESLEDVPVMAYAAQLTNEQFAEVFGRYVAERRGTVPELVDLLREAVRGHNDLGLGPSEYTQAWDLALRTYQQRHGLAPGAN
ncbi:hypothetical protein [Micromonospora yangpuensis]|uniref:hypothetical protein n=1 Tax=Micromonospora yangpuensis TaxID=683228 RepID=UPI001E659102|nr:hypothetical protein [Micromonospora yangpuensis]